MPLCGKRIGAVEEPTSTVAKGIWRVQLSHAWPTRSAVFDDPTLVSCAGLVPAIALAERAGLAALAGAHLSVPGAAGVAAGAKVSALVAGMVAGADSIADMDLLRHGGMARLFDGVRAPSTLGTFLRAFRFGQVRQLDAVAARVLAGLAQHAPIITASEPVTYLDMDDTVRQTFGYAKQGAGFGYSGVKGLNALLATVSTTSSAPVIVATRLRKGSANSARGAARLVADAIKTTRSCGVSGLVVLRADSAYYGADVIAAARRHRACFSITARKDRAVTAAIASIPEDAWTAIHYSAWLVLAAIAFNITRAAGTLASSFHAKATTATLRRQLINVAARVTRSARRATLHLPTAWPWATAWQQLFAAATGPPART
jgi:hypothetical protein